MSDEDPTRISPEEAFAIVADKTRLEILLTLGEAGEALSFSTLFDRSEYDTRSNFSYHLKQLADHFIERHDEGYVIRQAGRRIVEAVLAEAVPTAEDFDRTAVNWPCFLCGEPIEVSFREGHVGLYCPACGGTRNDRSSTGDGRLIDGRDVLGILDLPLAGTIDRSPQEVVEAADYWTTLEALAVARGMCPRCSANLKVSENACSEHIETDRPCRNCGQRFALTINYDCMNCIYTIEAPFGTLLLDDPALRLFMLDHGLDPFESSGFHIHALEETIHNTDPLVAELKYSINGDSIRFSVDDDLDVRLVSDDEAVESD